MSTSKQQRRPDDLLSIWEQIGVDPAKLAADRGGTIMPSSPPGPTGGTAPMQAAMPRLVIEGRVDDGQTPELRLGATLGQGGMGTVRTALQLPLGREVAVKMVHATGDDAPEAIRDLLREAWIAGRLEHPGIIPVHALGCDADGLPMLVMKRVHGMNWSEVLRDKDHPLRASHQGDPIDFDLQVLIQVCNALEFAHSKGILHRDIKPANVMLGDFGQVYVVDWGVAVTLVPDPDGLLPRAGDHPAVVGTPEYMAPEMVACDFDKITERTDVFLLGATLHEIITGRRRYLGADLPETLKLAYLATPYEYPPDVPEGLVRICKRATHRDPAKRYPGAAELRAALARFRLHRLLQ